MAVGVVLGTPLSEALMKLVQSKIVELSWCKREDGPGSADIIVLKLAEGETQEQFAKELLHHMGPYEKGVEEFARWLFEQVSRLKDVHKDVTMTKAKDKIVPFATSAPFKFQIGPQREEFILHRGLLQQISRPLHALMNGSMREAEAGTAFLEDVDEETFRQFISYAYVFASFPGNLVNVKEQDKALHDGPPTPTCMWCEGTLPVTIYCTDYLSYHPHTINDYLWQATTRKPVSRDESQSGRNFAYKYVEDRHQLKLSSQISLSSHAKLYKFAEKYLITNLKTVALVCLQNDFINMDVLDFPISKSKDSLADFLNLLSLTFDIDSQDAQEDDFQYSDMNDLQRLVSYFTVCKQAKLRQHREFRELLIRNGQIGLVLLYASQEMLGTASE